MSKIDFKKCDKALYSGRAGRFDILEVPPLPYLMIDGKGDPNSCVAFGKSIAALYSLSYTLKFHSKLELGKDYVVPPLEGLWWAEDMGAFTAGEKDQWQWTLMIRQPDWIQVDTVEQARDKAAQKIEKKKDAGTDLETIQKIEFSKLEEGTCVQVLHIGPYDDEGQILEVLHNEFIPQNNYRMVGKHHEIYLNDPRKTAPEKLKTLLRQPIRKIS